MRLGVKAALVGDVLVPGDVSVDDGRVSAIGLASPNGRGIVAPGFVDLQVNGFGGVDFLEADANGYERAGNALLETGVTAYLPTLITASEERLLAALAEVPAQTRAPRILGVHLEGPFISPARLGTHPARERRDPDAALLDRLLASGRVRLVTIAPELTGALELVSTLLQRRVAVSCGHTDATSKEAHAAFDCGARTVTHVFNAMRPFSHREPGVAGAALVRDDVIVQAIVDGVHLANETVELVWRAAAGRVALVSDAVAPAGVGGNGRFSFAGQDVEVLDGVVRRVSDGVLAGSVLTMIDAVRNLHALGARLEQALEAASAVPAQALGLDAGRIGVGTEADLVVLDDELAIERVLVGGETRVAS
jgi:N-acetylglucosamine-6-phosphate deacetylase